jgi:hypothetical protein
MSMRTTKNIMYMKTTKVKEMQIGIGGAVMEGGEAIIIMGTRTTMKMTTITDAKEDTGHLNLRLPTPTRRDPSLSLTATVKSNSEILSDKGFSSPQ